MCFCIGHDQLLNGLDFPVIYDAIELRQKFARYGSFHYTIARNCLMSTTTLTGGCHCGNIHLDISLPKSSRDYSPRACDCDFCRKHGASYISDPSGKLRMTVREPSDLGRYKQGSGVSDCLVCRNCGVLVGYSYQEGDQTWVVVNSRALDGAVEFATETPVSPKLLSQDKKTERWKQIWFHDVEIKFT
jgi:hypothetical protein